MTTKKIKWTDEETGILVVEESDYDIQEYGRVKLYTVDPFGGEIPRISGKYDFLNDMDMGALKRYMDGGRAEALRKGEKPWLDAEEGEVWSLGVGGGYHCASATVIKDGGEKFFVWGVKGGELRKVGIIDRSIDYAKRIWPEGD